MAAGGAPCSSTNRWVLTTLLLAAAATVIEFGALGSLQDMLHGQQGMEMETAFSSAFGFSNVLHGKKFLRFYWFIIAFEIAVVSMGIYAVMNNMYSKLRNALVGLFVVATLLFMLAADAFLTANDNIYFEEGLQRDRMRTSVAGWIITATFNALLVAVIGCDC